MNKCFLGKIVALYLIVVVISALINWILFLKNPTCFLISEQLNKHLVRYEFEAPEKRLELYLKSAADTIPITFGGFEEKTKPLVSELAVINNALAYQQAVLSDSSNALDSLLDVASEVRSDSISVFRHKNLAPLQNRIDSLKSLMEGRDVIELASNGLSVKLADAQVEFALKNAQIQNYILSNYAAFIPDNLSDEIWGMHAVCEESRVKIQYFKDSLNNVSDRLLTLSNAFYHNSIKTVRLCDFLYYSFCVSTSMSFSDIVPNDFYTRLVAVIELVFCIVIVGLIVNYLDPYRKKNN